MVKGETIVKRFDNQRVNVTGASDTGSSPKALPL
jgi:hypothetical protein